jgi:hypothetical protein
MQGTKYSGDSMEVLHTKHLETIQRMHTAITANTKPSPLDMAAVTEIGQEMKKRNDLLRNMTKAEFLASVLNERRGGSVLNDQLATTVMTEVFPGIFGGPAASDEKIAMTCKALTNPELDVAFGTFNQYLERPSNDKKLSAAAELFTSCRKKGEEAKAASNAKWESALEKTIAGMVEDVDNEEKDEEAGSAKGKEKGGCSEELERALEELAAMRATIAKTKAGAMKKSSDEDSNNKDVDNE